MTGHPGLIRRALAVGNEEISYLHAGEGPAVMLLAGTYWSRVWQPVMPRLARDNAVFALDYPGFGYSGGRLSLDKATVPALATLLLQAADALGIEDFAVAGHDIGGAVAQHLAAREGGRVSRLALVNSVLYDSWPVEAVARFRDADVARNISSEELVELRRRSLRGATARELSVSEEEDYLSPWREEDKVRSWTAMAAAADSRYTLELIEPLRKLELSTLLVWGEQDEFQPIGYARRFERELPSAQLVAVPGARHIPMEDSPERVGEELAAFFARDRESKA